MMTKFALLTDSLLERSTSRTFFANLSSKDPLLPEAASMLVLRLIRRICAGLNRVPFPSATRCI